MNRDTSILRGPSGADWVRARARKLLVRSIWLTCVPRHRGGDESDLRELRALRHNELEPNILQRSDLFAASRHSSEDFTNFQIVP